MRYFYFIYFLKYSLLLIYNEETNEISKGITYSTNCIIIYLL